MATQTSVFFPQQQSFRRRLPFVVVALILASLLMLGRLASFQFQIGLSPEALSYLESVRDAGYNRELRIAANRGNIYDRRGEVLAVNTLEYQVGLSPRLLEDPRTAATQLAAVLGRPELDMFEAATADVPWVLLASRVSAEVGQRLTALNMGSALQMSPIPRRSYPQGTLASQVIGFVGGDLTGYYGVEGYYQGTLEGQVRDRTVSNIPFEAQQADYAGDEGADIVLTIDRDVQYIVESQLMNAMSQSGAESGSIIVMNPRNGDILGLANFPTFDPNAYFNVEDPAQLVNLGISGNYEPGSVMKIITVAAALDRGVIEPGFTYFDNGSLEVGGITVQNWDRAAHGTVDTTQILVQSLNIGAATLAMMMGPDNFYPELNEFGFGRRTGVDLQGEESGIFYAPGNPNWAEANIATNSFGQGISVTPLQMLTAVNAIANGGLMMQPRVVHQINDNGEVFTSQPTALGRPISAETASIVTQMMVAVVEDGLDESASLPGYTIAGKTGTAEIPTPFGYEAGTSIVTFVGFLPADDPQVSILIRLDRPREYWASVVAAPVFRDLAERLVVQLAIPPDATRRELALQGGSISGIPR
jgi:cell division protein FtsI (penicillin-binding protein 3)